jgi:tetratricopeptide (TPR) repeat protein
MHPYRSRAANGLRCFGVSAAMLLSLAGAAGAQSERLKNLESWRLEPNVATTLDSRGLTYLKLGEWDLAIDDYSSALQLDPKLASSMYGRGFAKLKKGDVAGVDTDIGAAKEINANILGDFVRYGVQ